MESDSEECVLSCPVTLLASSAEIDSMGDCQMQLDPYSEDELKELQNEDDDDDRKEEKDEEEDDEFSTKRQVIPKCQSALPFSKL